jgi:hypothetical protein
MPNRSFVFSSSILIFRTVLSRLSRCVSYIDIIRLLAVSWSTHQLRCPRFWLLTNTRNRGWLRRLCKSQLGSTAPSGRRWASNWSVLPKGPVRATRRTLKQGKIIFFYSKWHSAEIGWEENIKKFDRFSLDAEMIKTKFLTWREKIVALDTFFFLRLSSIQVLTGPNPA